MRLMLVPFAAPCVMAEAVAADPPAKPNVLLTLDGDLGYPDLGCYGGEITTPNLDELANNGTRFRRFSNGTCSCHSRSRLLTGL